MGKEIKDIAKVMYDNMEYKTRTNGDRFYCCKNTIEWQQDIIRESHPDNRLPSDEVYEVITNTLELLQEVDNEEEAQDSILEIEADIYTSDLTKWLNSDNRNVYYLDEAISNGSTTGIELLTMAQYLFKQEIANAVLQGIQAYIEGLE